MFVLKLQAEKRAHHNALERKRRDHIKDSFTSLREAVPALQGEKVKYNPYFKDAKVLSLAYPAKLLSGLSWVGTMGFQLYQLPDPPIFTIKNAFVSVRAMEKARATGNYMDAHELGIKSEGSSHDTDSSDGEGTTRRVKKLKINSVNV
ncbi:jg20338 [Pararge aegeria aegeria]|uniref:Jg20338 protein n=1 Tax=Pararge aegeria aegeria TaxID=348720 RepID=A0A8S4RAV4_9NEOP|nr:jg20338 [Pararge aegeria aegeria]